MPDGAWKLTGIDPDGVDLAAPRPVSERAARMEAAARHVELGRGFVDHGCEEPLVGRGIRRDRGEQSVRVRVDGVPEELVAWPDSTMRPPYITARRSDMYRTTARSLTKRYVTRAAAAARAED
jgi:hypothetical protein